jgi:hypothetical protein
MNMVRQRVPLHSRNWQPDRNDNGHSNKEHQVTKIIVDRNYKRLYICCLSFGILLFVYVYAFHGPSYFTFSGSIRDLRLSTTLTAENLFENIENSSLPSFTEQTHENEAIEVHGVTSEKTLHEDKNRQENHGAACYRMKSEKDIRNCYPTKHVKQFKDPQCQTIQNWNDVQRCLVGRFQYNGTESAINEVHILGERNSGTKFVTNALQRCYPKSSGVKVHRDFLRQKHFFQPIESGDFSRSLVVVVVRDPVEWMAAMRELPYHSPNHLKGFRNVTNEVIPLTWQEFVNKPWTAVTSTIDLTLRDEDRHQPICTNRFRIDEVTPCSLDNVTAQGAPWNIPMKKWRGYSPVYEQRRGTPYEHLLQMRADKIVNWILQIPLLMKIGGFAVVRYDDILNRGDEFFLKQVDAILHNRTSERQHLPARCSTTPPQPHRIGKRTIPHDFREWINQNIDVDSEKIIRYRQ